MPHTGKPLQDILPPPFIPPCISGRPDVLRAPCGSVAKPPGGSLTLLGGHYNSSSSSPRLCFFSSIYLCPLALIHLLVTLLSVTCISCVCFLSLPWCFLLTFGDSWQLDLPPTESAYLCFLPDVGRMLSVCWNPFLG